MSNEIEHDSKALKCSPHSDDEKHSVDESKTCYSNNSLEKLKSAWNARHSDEPITTNDPNEVWAFLRQQMSRVCKNEACWLRKLLISEDKGKYRDLLNYTFAPRAPKTWIKKPTTWLTSVDIENVMKQYGEINPPFGSVCLNYVEIGKTLLDLVIDNDTYISDEAFQPFWHYNPDFVVKFFEFSSNEVDTIMQTMQQYYQEHYDFFAKHGYPQFDHVKLQPLQFPVARIIETVPRDQLIKDIQQRQLVTRVYIDETMHYTR